MARLVVPPRFRRGYEALAVAGEDLFERVVSVLEQATPGFYPPSLVDAVAAQFGGDAADVSAMLDAALTAQALRESGRADAEKVARDIGDGEGLDLPEAEREVMVRRLARLLDVGVLRLSVRAADLASVDEKLMTSATVIADLRPVFRAESDDGPLTPQGAFILYRLRINFHQDAGDGSVVLTLDTSDVRKLQTALLRAQSEGDALQGLIRKAGLEEIPMEGSVDG